ncbi:MAG: isoprenoid biosynthesis glyoxalase ElbB [Thermoplasmatota archaeon]
MKKVAVLLAGCGVYDGSEIHESVIALLSIARGGHSYQCFAPDRPQKQVIDHLTGQEMGEERNVLTESARIARGDIQPLSGYRPERYDALIIPGGSGVAKNLFTYALDGEDCHIDEEVQQAIVDTHAAGKPLGAICISPLLVVRAFKGTAVKPTVTLGNDRRWAEAVRHMGGRHEERTADAVCIDEKNTIVTCPAYTIARTIAEAAAGIEKLVDEVLRRAG